MDQRRRHALPKRVWQLYQSGRPGQQLSWTRDEFSAGHIRCSGYHHTRTDVVTQQLGPKGEVGQILFAVQRLRSCSAENTRWNTIIVPPSFIIIPSLQVNGVHCIDCVSGQSIVI